MKSVVKRKAMLEATNTPVPGELALEFHAGTITSRSAWHICEEPEYGSQMRSNVRSNEHIGARRIGAGIPCRNHCVEIGVGGIRKNTSPTYLAIASGPTWAE